MKKLYFLRLMLASMVCTTTHTLLYAQSISLIDIDKYTNSWPRNNEYSAKNTYVLYNGYSYFDADDGIHGRELWKTDGTARGTKLVKDVNPGSDGSIDETSDGVGYDLTVSGGKLYFAAFGGSLSTDGLWVTDGTSAGTHFVADPSNGNVIPGYLTDLNGILYFAETFYNYNTGSYTNQLWKTDGTAGGTVLVIDLGSYGNSLEQLTNVNGKLFFTFFDYNTSTTDLYVSDGTADGTSMVGGYYLNSLVNFQQLTSSNGVLYFIGDDNSGTGTKLFQSDGTVAGTYALNNNGITCYATSNNIDRDTFAIVNNVLYFQGSDYTGDNTLYKYDENNAATGVTLVKDMVPGISSYPSFMTNVNGTLFFTIGPAGADAELWKSDGTDAGTVLVKDINPGGLNGYYGLTAVGNFLMFAFGDNATGYDLWKSDGTAAGTKIVKDINPGIYSSFPQYLTYNSGLLLFGAFDGVNGYELWKSNGTASGTSMIKDINKTSSTSSYPYGFTSMADNKVVFSASDEEHGREPWITDGTVSGTKLLKDINTAVYDASPSFFTKLKNKMYFFAYDSTGFHLWRTNGTAAGTQKILTPTLDNDPDYLYIEEVIPANDIFYIYILNQSNFQQELWRSDGTAGGTYPVKQDIAYSYDPSIAVIGNTLYFSASDAAYQYGVELWKSDGTPATTNLVKDIIPGTQGSYPFGLTNFNGKLYFAAANSDGTFNNVLWTSDGTDAGTKVVKPLIVYPNYPTAFAQANGKLFFYGENVVSKGPELYESDGTSRGTKLVKDIYKGDNSSDISLMVSGDTLIYFTANDNIHGQELWKSNGTSAGTSLVKDITPGANGTSFNSNMVSIHNNLYFIVNDTLWQSDGTKKGTNPISNAILEGVSSINNLTNINGTLYFTATSYAVGNELYVLNPFNTAATIEMANNNIISKPDENEFFAKLLTNPVTDQLRFTVTIKNQQEAKVMIMDMSGRILANDKQTLLPGTNTLSYNTSGWAKGIYIVNIVTSEKFNSTLRALK